MYTKHPPNMHPISRPRMSAIMAEIDAVTGRENVSDREDPAEGMEDPGEVKGSAAVYHKRRRGEYYVIVTA